MEARRLTLPQVSLYLGAWVLAVGAALLTFFPYPALAGAPAVIARLGRRRARGLDRRARLAARLLPRGHRVTCWRFAWWSPVAALVTLEEARLFTALTQGNLKLELFHRLEFAKPATNAQIWWALLAGLPVCWWLRRFTRAPVFSLMFAAMSALLCLATLLRLGMLDCLDRDPGRFYFHLIPCAVLFMAAGFGFERRRLSDDSRYFYPFAVAFTWAALTGVADVSRALGPLAEIRRAVDPRPDRVPVPHQRRPSTSLLDRLCDRFSSPQVRTVGKSFRFVIPGPRDDLAAAAWGSMRNGASKRASSSGSCRPPPASSSSPAFPAR